MSHLDAYDWISPLPPTPDVPPQVQAAQKRQQNFRDEAHVSNDKSIPGYQRLHGVAPGEMCTLDSRNMCLIPGIHCPHQEWRNDGEHIFTVEEAITLSGPPDEDRGGPKSLSQGTDYGRAR